VALGQDLCANQDAGLVAQRCQRLFQGIAAAGGAAVDTQHRVVWKQLQ